MSTEARLVEQVAEALFDTDWRSRRDSGVAPHGWKDTNHYWRQHYTVLAGAAIEAAQRTHAVVELPLNQREHEWFYEDDGDPHRPLFGAVADEFAVAFWEGYGPELQVYQQGFVQEPISVEQAKSLAAALLAAVNAAESPPVVGHPPAVGLNDQARRLYDPDKAVILAPHPTQPKEGQK